MATINSNELVISIIRSAVVFFGVLSSVPLLVWMERKGSAYIQDRRGPNRAVVGIFRFGGLLHSLADGVKILTKEFVCPSGASKALFFIAPVIALFAAMAGVAVIPFGAPIKIGELTVGLQVADLSVGLVFVMAMSALGVFAVLMAGWGANNKYSLIGAMRGAAQVISYELAMALACAAIFLMTGSLRISDIVAMQGPLVWDWNIMRAPVAFFVFFAALIAEAMRTPFDLTEGDTELVAGYHVEYSSMGFGMFFMAEYVHVFVGSLLMATLFFGGWKVPFVDTATLRAGAGAILATGWLGGGVFLFLAGLLLALRFKRRYKRAWDLEPVVLGLMVTLAGVAGVVTYVISGEWELLPWAPAVIAGLVQVASLVFKTLLICAAFIWVRWSLPRFRYDQLMAFGWKFLVPIGVLNLIVTAVIMWMRS